MRRIAGRLGRRLIPIMDQSDKTVAPEIQRDWTILDTYDALSASFDQPQKPSVLREWFEEAGFRHFVVKMESGLIGRGIK